MQQIESTKMAESNSNFQIIAELVGDIGWPIAFFAAVFLFRKEIKVLLGRATGLKFGGAEMAFQTAEDDPELPSSSTENEGDSRTQDVYSSKGFISEAKIKQFVSAKYPNLGEVVDAIKIFSTAKQHTWLVFTDEKLFCVLDSERTRSKRRLIQWVQNLAEIDLVKARQTSLRSGRVNIGNRRNWLYSSTLFPTEQDLIDAIESAMEEARSN